MKMTNISRRGFIIMTAISAGVVVAYPLLEKFTHFYPQVEFKNLLFRGTYNGLVQASEDHGKTWVKKMNFGNEIRIIDLVKVNEQLVTQLGIGDNTFELISDDGQKWITM
jgi:hypothetical protein